MLYANGINQLRFEYENRLFQELNQQQEIETLQNAMQGQRYFNLHKRHLLGTAVKITNVLFPELNTIYQNCLTRIGGGINGHLYVHQASEYNAHVYSHEQCFDILVTSALIKDFKPTEIAFVIGHELGHVLFEHNKIPASWLLFDEHAPKISNTLAKRLFQWSRAAEISADRIGFLACGNLSSAANAFFKTASGLQLNDDNRVVQALRTQYDEIKDLTTQIHSPSASTHPLIPIRFKSLELVSLDLVAFRNNHKQLRIQDLNVINQEVQNVLEHTDPINLQDYTNAAPPPVLSNQEALSLLILCLLYVAISDGALRSVEEKFIRDLTQRTNPPLQIDGILQDYYKSANNFATELLTEIATCTVPHDQMVDILHHCGLMCQNINSNEINAMKTLCNTLHSPTALVDALLSIR